MQPRHRDGLVAALRYAVRERFHVVNLSLGIDIPRSAPLRPADYKSIVGPVKWTGQPVKNVTKTPLVAGQWQRKGDKFDLVITTNKTATEIPTGGQLQLLS